MELDRIAELLTPFLTTVDRVPRPLRSLQRAGVSARSSSDVPRSEERSDEEFLSPAQLQQISTYIDLLLRWNQRINLTSVRDAENIVTRHFGESLFAARHLFPSSAHVGAGVLTCPAEPPTGEARASSPVQSPNAEQPATADLIDVGSGAGFPGLPIKIWAADVLATLIESNHKKATFLREVIRTLTLTDIDVSLARAEQFPTIGHVVTLRAVERFATVLPVAARMLAPQGCLALLIGESQVETAHELTPNLTWSEPIPVPLSSQRVLAIGSRPRDRAPSIDQGMSQDPQ